MLSGISIWQLLILLVIVLLIFGSKRLRHLGPDLGSALKGFRSAMKDDEQDKSPEEEPKAVDHVQRSEQTGEQGGSGHADVADQPDSTHRRD